MDNVKHKDQRVAIFIDAQNLYHSARSLFGARVNFKEILRAAVAGRKLVRAFAYVISTESGEEKPFFEALVSLGIETRAKDLQEFHSGAKKADWDVGLTIDAVRTASLVDVVVICSGDGDFIPLVEYLKHNGRRVEVFGFGRSASMRLKEAADEFIDLAGDSGKFIMRSGKVYRARRERKPNGEHQTPPSVEEITETE